MFKLRYNILALIQVIIFFINTVFLIQVFGASNQSDAYLIAISITDALALIQLLFVEQFMYFYHDQKVKDEEQAYLFYNSAITLAILSGIVFFVILFFGLDVIVKLFAFSLDPVRMSILKNIVFILIFSFFFLPVNYVNQKLLNAEMKFSIPYLLQIFYSFFITLSLIYLLLSNQKNIELLAYARVFGIFLAFVCGVFFVHKLGIPIRLRLNHPVLKDFLKNSFSMRLGINIHNLLFNPITTNILSSFPVGYASCFYYAQMIIIAINSIIVGPSSSVLLSKVSELWPLRKMEEIIDLMKKFLKNTLPIFIITVIISYLLIPFALNIISSGTLVFTDIDIIKSIFFGLAIWYAVILIESPFVSVCLASRSSRLIIFTNTIFITLFFSISFLFKNQVGIMVIPLAAIIGQIVNFILFSNFALKIFGTSTIRLIKQKMDNFLILVKNN